MTLMRLYDARDLNGRLNAKNGAWECGMVFSAPLWVGTKFGNTVDRFGFAHPLVQNATQNSVHISKWLPFAHAPFFSDYSKFRTGFYSFSGYYNSYSLFER